jgi:hypothetical protein
MMGGKILRMSPGGWKTVVVRGGNKREAEGAGMGREGGYCMRGGGFISRNFQLKKLK